MPPPTDTVPAPQTALTEMTPTALASTHALPKRLLESGFTFAFPNIEGALTAALAET